MFKGIISRVSTMIQTQLAAMTTFLVRLLNTANNAVQFIQQKIQKFFQNIMARPRSKKNYWQFFGLYFSKRFVCMSIIGIGVVGYFLVYYAVPWAEGKVWTANLRLDTLKYSKFTGKARVFDTSDNLVFEGNLEKGSPKGTGIQYDSQGKVIYKGNFEGGKYSGDGELYNSDGILTYTGGFANNLYSGEGKLYNTIGKLIYDGSFAVGQRSGMGAEYDPDTGLKKYYGQHENDALNGNAVEFGSDGKTIHYEGNFKDGSYGGEGKLYSGTALQYAGNFERGMYNGTGNLYDLDTGSVVYSGEFKDGVYDGKGSLYDTSTSVIIYSGEFSNGKRQGKGTSYDKLGSELFSGNFRSDSIDYIAYLGKSPDDVASEFGQETYKTETNGKMIVTYRNLDASIVFKIDSEKGEYVCEKIVLGTKESFMGLGANSTAVERRSVMGEPFSSINYSCPDYYKTVFSHLGININNVKSIPCDKYILDNYFIRFYFNDGRTELKCIEICSM